jgi:hypothetical protein
MGGTMINIDWASTKSIVKAIKDAGFHASKDWTRKQIVVTAKTLVHTGRMAPAAFAPSKLLTSKQIAMMHKIAYNSYGDAMVQTAFIIETDAERSVFASLSRQGLAVHNGRQRYHAMCGLSAVGKIILGVCDGLRRN